MQIQENISLKPFNSFGIDAIARNFAGFHSIDELQEGILFHQNKFSNTPAPYILGGGSNILFTKNVDNLVLKNNINGIQKIDEDNDFVYVKAGAGESWHGFVEYCINNNYAGVENLSLIPGNVGASPMQNIGAYGVEIKDVFHSLEAFHLKEKEVVNFSLPDCEFRYRESVFKGKYKNQFAITSVSFRLRKKPAFNISYGAISQEMEKMNIEHLSIAAVSQAVIKIRQSKLPDPAVIGNAGSFFKNPEVPDVQYHQLQNQFPGIVGYPLHTGNTKLAAGWLIEQCGWKGYRMGDAGCHERQALVLVNFGNATGEQIIRLSQDIINSVNEKFGIALQKEVNII